MAPLLARLRIDPYILALLAAVGIATVLPCRGQVAAVLGGVADGGIGLLFFLYGGRLPRHVIVTGMTQWRLQLVVLLATFVFFPVLGLGFRAALAPWMPAALLSGIVFLTVLPSTVQSSIAFTSIARGNIPAAICSATVSNLAGVFVTPLLVTLLLEKGEGASASLDAVWKIVGFLLVPFVVGHALRPLIGGWLERNKHWLGYVDRGSILFIVYIAFSEGVVGGIWHQLPPASIALLGVVSAALLAVVMIALTWLARRLGFGTEDEIAIVFCGSKKSLASGLPMAKLLFAGPTVGLIVLPLMLFHQLQLMVCAALARRYARRQGPAGVLRAGEVD
ncbi:MAG: bile acid:sodium symporter [Labilithrix sp.]|nr:bile acid:sodium symporter [Labilithrix sp.]